MTTKKRVRKAAKAVRDRAKPYRDGGGERLGADGLALKQFNARLPRDVHTALRIRALQDGIAAGELVEDLLREFLRMPERKGDA